MAAGRLSTAGGAGAVAPTSMTTKPPPEPPQPPAVSDDGDENGRPEVDGRAVAVIRAATGHDVSAGASEVAGPPADTDEAAPDDEKPQRG